MKNIYFDVLDTARTADGRPSELERARVEECISLGRAELQLAVMLGGLRPVFPQTSGFDSAALLRYAGEEAAFISLVRKGSIRIAHLERRPLWDVARGAFQDPRYALGYGLSAWPELNGETPLVEKRAVAEAMDAGTKSSALPTKVCDRLEALRELSAAVSAADKLHGIFMESRRGDQIRESILKTVDAAEPLDETVAGFLRRCTRLPDPNRRGEIDEFLNAEERSGGLPAAVREVTNSCFNAVAARCVEATPALTFNTSTPIARAIMRIAHTDSVQSDVFHGEIKEPSPQDYGDLKPMTWAKVLEFVQEYEGLELGERRRRAVLAGLIARTKVDDAPRYVERWDKVAKGVVVGGATAAVAHFSDGQTASSRRKFLSPIAGFVIGTTGALACNDLRVQEDRHIEFERVHKHWLGLLLP